MSPDGEVEHRRVPAPSSSSSRCSPRSKNARPGGSNRATKVQTEDVAVEGDGRGRDPSAASATWCNRGSDRPGTAARCVFTGSPPGGAPTVPLGSPRVSPYGTAATRRCGWSDSSGRRGDQVVVRDRRGRPRRVGRAGHGRRGRARRPSTCAGVRDSKQLTRPERERGRGRGARWAVAVGVGHASHEECDELGHDRRAARRRRMRALAQLDAQGYVPDRIVLDGNHDYLAARASRVTTVIKGDATCLAVAAASCVAKVTRDAHDARGGRALPAVRLRVERGLSGARAQGRARGLRAERDPPAVVDLHGGPVLARACRRRRVGCSPDVDPASDGEGAGRWMSTSRRCTRGRSTRPRRFVAGVGDDQWDDRVGLRATGPCASW